jgi:hypothetical protein
MGLVNISNNRNKDDKNILFNVKIEHSLMRYFKQPPAAEKIHGREVY